MINLKDQLDEKKNPLGYKERKNAREKSKCS